MKKLLLLTTLSILTGCTTTGYQPNVYLQQVGDQPVRAPALASKLYPSNDNVNWKPVARGESWATKFPNYEERRLALAVNRTNIGLHHFSHVASPKQRFSLFGDDLGLQYSPFEPMKQPTGERAVYIDINKAAYAAYDELGQQVMWGPISAGKDCNTNYNCKTNRGSFRVFRIKGADCVSNKYPLETNGGGKMPYCMFFDGGIALHGGKLPGYHDSEGCVRMLEQDAKWLHQNFIEIGTRVTVI